MISEKLEHSGLLSKRDRIIAILKAIRQFFTLKLIVSEKCLKREFEAIPGYQFTCEGCIHILSVDSPFITLLFLKPHCEPQMI